MIKAVLFDLDGVVIVNNGKRFSERLAEKLNKPVEDFSEFFTGDFRECSYGRADLREKISPYLVKLGYEGSFEDLLKFWFENEGEVDKEIIKIVQELRSKGLKCYIATRQEKNRKEYLLNQVGLVKDFDGIFCTCDIGYDKSQKEYWDYVSNKLNLRPEEIMFFCDGQKNVDLARTLGVESYLYEGVDFLKERVAKIR